MDRRCKSCDQLLPITKFPRNPRKLKDGKVKEYFGYTCMVCWRNKHLSNPEKREIHRRGSNNWYINNPEKAKSQRLKRYGIDFTQYNDMRKNQNYRCAICNLHESEVARGRAKSSETALCVDHCHTTKKVRGLLCTNCNTLIGKSQENPLVLSSAIRYLVCNDRPCSFIRTLTP